MASAPVLVVVSVSALLLAAVAPAPVHAATTAFAQGTTVTAHEVGPTALTQADADENRSDPARDVRGWESVNGTGLWHNESIAVTQEDGLNQTELDAVVARGMARVEVVRDVEFERSVPVSVISRAEFRNRTLDSYRNVSPTDRLHQNVKWEATFMIGEDTDALAVQGRNRASGTLGYYSFSRERIVVVSENTTAPRMNEITLSQELFHALQDRQFGISEFNQTTEELHNARDGIIEGDGNYVDELYRQRCRAEWNCLLPPGVQSGGVGDRHVGLLILTLQPYSDGPPFVQDRHREGGWAAVDRMYENPPASTEQVIHPERYPEDEPQVPKVNHSTSEGWTVLDLPGDGINHASFGEAGVFTMFWYPSWEARQDVVVPFDIFDQPGVDLYDYDHPYSAGWDGDTLVPYVRNDSVETNETAYVWKTVWDTDRDAREFVTGYRRLLDHHGAEPAVGVANTTGAFTVVIPDGSPFADAFYVERSDTTVTVVNAPTVDDLRSVHAGAAPRATTTATTVETETETDPTTTTTTETTTETTTPVTTEPLETTTTETTRPPAQPGFGAGLTFLAVVALAVAALARSRLGTRRR
jgi:hypothetical protein